MRFCGIWIGSTLVLNGSDIFAVLIQYDSNPVVLLKYLIQSGFYPKKTVIKHFIAVINVVGISIFDPKEFFRNPVSSEIPESWPLRNF